MGRKQAAVWCCLLEIPGCCSGSGAIIRHTLAAWLDLRDAGTCVTLAYVAAYWKPRGALDAFCGWLYIHVLTDFICKVEFKSASQNKRHTAGVHNHTDRHKPSLVRLE